MSESYVVIAKLSAEDKGFTAAMKRATGSTETLGSKLKSGLGFGVFMGIGNAAVSAVTRGFTGMISEMSSSSAAWQTFEGNMKNFGKASQIPKVKKELQTFAQQTIYSSSDMASTYAQLAAVGTKNTDKLVMGFGGLASAAENPQQAMKTLSQQATQMAAKPTVQWMDFKLMLEQTPAGISGVAKAMGKTSSQLIQDVQAGKVKTDDFFKAITRVGTSDAWAKQARQYKTVGQAMDGLKETMGNKLLPIFNAVSQIMISDISKITDASGKLNTQKIGSWITDHADGIRKGAKALGIFVVALGGMKIVNSVSGTFGTFVGNIKSLASPKLLGRLIPNLTATAGGEAAVGTASKTSAKDIMAAGVAFMALGAGVALVCAGFYLLANAAIKVAAAGPAAALVMLGMVAAIIVLTKAVSTLGPQFIASAVGFAIFGAGLLICAAAMYVMASAATMLAASGGAGIACLLIMTVAIAALIMVVSLMGPALIVGAVGLILFGAGLLLCAVAGLICATAFQMIAAAMPTVAQYGMLCAASMLAIGGAMLIFSAMALVAFGACFVLGAGLLVLGGGAIVAMAGMLMFGMAMIIGAAGTLLMAASLKLVNTTMKSIAGNAKRAEGSLKSMRSSIGIVNSGLSALGSVARSALSRLISSFNNAAAKARSAGTRAGTGFSTGLKGGLSKAPGIASTEVNSTVSKLRAGYSRAHSAGSYISKGFALGMRSELSTVESAADKLADAADKAVRAKAKIGSPSRIAKREGHFWGGGLALGLLDMVGAVKTAGIRLVDAASFAQPQLAYAGNFGSELSGDYEYFNSAKYTIEVPLNIDGKEAGRVIAPYTEAELNKRQTRANRKKGIR